MRHRALQFRSPYPRRALVIPDASASSHPSDIAAIRKEKTARIIPNAIQIQLKSDVKYTFSSFLARDTTYRCLMTVWQNAVSNAPLSATEILEGVTRGCQAR